MTWTYSASRSSLGRVAIDVPARHAVQEIALELLAQPVVLDLDDAGDVGVRAAIGSVSGIVKVLDEIRPVLCVCRSRFCR